MAVRCPKSERVPKTHTGYICVSLPRRGRGEVAKKLGLDPFGKSPKEDGERLTRPFKLIDGPPRQNVCFAVVKNVKSLGTSGYPASFAFTASLTFLPSTVFPASPAMVAFITLPMSFALVAPVSAIAAATAAATSSSEAEAGR